MDENCSRLPVQTFNIYIHSSCKHRPRNKKKKEKIPEIEKFCTIFNIAAVYTDWKQIKLNWLLCQNWVWNRVKWYSVTSVHQYLNCAGYSNTWEYLTDMIRDLQKSFIYQSIWYIKLFPVCSSNSNTGACIKWIISIQLDMWALKMFYWRFNRI